MTFCGNNYNYFSEDRTSLMLHLFAICKFFSQFKGGEGMAQSPKWPNGKYATAPTDGQTVTQSVSLALMTDGLAEVAVYHCFI